VLLEKRLKFSLDLGVGGNIGADPTLPYRLGVVVDDDRGDLGRGLVVGARKGGGAEGRVHLFGRL
jgi:hypothetical protein